MKKSLLTALLGIAALTSAIGQNTAFNASGPGEQQATVFNDYGFPNSYTIDYSPFCTGGPCTTTSKQLTAMVADDGVTAKLYVDDQTNPPGTPWTTVVLPSGGGSAPDVVIGNDSANPGQYIVGVVAVMGGKLMYYTYSITGVGGPLAIVGPTSTIVISTANAIPPAHIDIACSTAIPYMGLPGANFVAMTWQDAAMGIMGNTNQLNGPNLGINQVIDPNLNASNPDVAYVELNAAGNKLARFSYFDLTVAAPGNILYYSDWKTLPWGVVTAPTPYDNTKFYYNPYPFMVSVGRIDAIDDYTKNIPANARFCIAASATTASGTIGVYEYNDKTGIGVATDITSPVFLPGGGIANATNEIPVVACGPGKFYSIGFYSDPGSSSGGAQKMYYAVAVNWPNGLPLGSPNNNAYGIMSGSYDPMYDPGLCLSATCNRNTLGIQDLFAGFDNYAFIWYKYSLPIPYSFKEAATPAPVVVAASSEWQVYPNPASSNVTLVAPDGFNTTIGASYDITDMSGKTLKSNAVNATKHQINVSNLPAGSYLINVHTDAKDVKTIKFVKE